MLVVKEGRPGGRDETERDTRISGLELEDFGECCPLEVVVFES